MSNTGSVAPKERVNIVYRPATGDAREEVELPLKILALGDFTLADDGTPIDEMRPVGIDRDNFNAVLKGQQLALQFGVPNRIDPARGDTIAVALRFETIDDFTPDAVVAQVPQLRRLIALRDALKALKGPLGNIPEFRRRIEALVDDPEIRGRLFAELGIASGALAQPDDEPV